MDEGKLLAKLQRKPSKVLETVIGQYGAYVAAICRNRSRGMLPAQDLEEISADVFVALWEHAAEIEPGRLRAWLGGVARNKTADRLRHYSIDVPLEEGAELLSEDLFESLADRERRQVLRDALERLSTQDREIFYRYYDLCQTAQEIADTLSMNPSTVRTRLCRGRESLKKYLCEGGYFREI